MCVRTSNVVSVGRRSSAVWKLFVFLPILLVRILDTLFGPPFRCVDVAQRLTRLSTGFFVGNLKPTLRATIELQKATPSGVNKLNKLHGDNGLLLFGGC